MSASGVHTCDVMAQACVAEGVSHAFALLGDGNMHFAASLEAAGCRFTHVRHEHCAVAAAMAYQRVSGELGFVTVTCGPGLTQIMTGLVAAVRARMPMVIVAGEAPLNSPWYNQGVDQAPFIQACGAAYYALHDQRQLAFVMQRAFHEARTLQQPVVIGVPFDLQESAWALSAPYVPSTAWPQVDGRTRPSEEALAHAVAVIQSAQRVIVVGGRGAVTAGAKAECEQLAERVDGLLATTLPARGLFHDAPFSLNVAGGFSSEVAKRCFAQADLVVMVGGRLASHASDAGRLHPKAQVLHIDESPAVLSQGRLAAQHHLRGDAKLALQDLLAALPEARPAVWRSPELAHEIDTLPMDARVFERHDGRLDPRDVIPCLDQALPKDWMMVNSSGHCSFYAVHMKGRSVSRFLTIREFGAIGNGLAFAMGASVATPEVPTVLFDGDGSFLMHAQELETIRRHGLPILVCVLNDGGYGSEVHKLRADGVSLSGAHFGYDDLAAVARGFGLRGVKARTLAEVQAAVQTFQADSRQAMVIDIDITDEVLSPVMRRLTGQA